MAIENASLTLRPGEIHALLGENGSGKSTLMHILAGYILPTSGTILVNGKERRFPSPADALALGIGMVRQHPGFIRSFKVWEDCILGAEKEGRSIFLNPESARKRLEEKAVKWRIDLPLDGQSDSLTVSQRQKAAVLALLLRNVKWFIFDEPTAVLTPEETAILFDLFRHLRSEGCGIILITHKIAEALSIADQVTVMRHGVTGEADDEYHFQANSGDHVRRNAEKENNYSSASLPTKTGNPILEIRNLRLKSPGLSQIENINLDLMPGTITGITGVRDGGLETLELAVAGLLDSGLEGSIALNGRDITGKGVRAFRDAGGAYLGADRLRYNLAPELPLFESLVIHIFRRARHGIFFHVDKLNAWCRGIMKRAGIERSVSDKASSFSGGMLQRILLAREFSEEASLVVLAEPGSALDQFNRSLLTEELKALTRRGASALLFSTDMEELTSIANEILVLRDGTLAASTNTETVS